LAKAEILTWKIGMMGKYIQEKSEISHEGEIRSNSYNQMKILQKLKYQRG